MEEEYKGVVEDPRSEAEKALDYKYEDLGMGDVKLKWIEYDEKHLKTFPIQNQDGSSSCVAQGTSKILAMHEVKEGRTYKQLCPKFIYTRRQNYPDGGMWLPNALSIACKYGTCEENLMPCDSKGESFMNDKTETSEQIENAQNYRAKYYFEITGGIDKIAEVLEQGYGVLLGFRFDRDEWTDVPFVKEGALNKLGHGVACVDYCLYKGEKSLVIEDSWGYSYGKGGRRIITDTFLKAKCFYAGYLTSLTNFKFTKTLKMGSKSLDVRKLQEKLGIKPIDGIFGNKTKTAVINFQFDHDLKPDGVVGPLTNKELNK